MIKRFRTTIFLFILTPALFVGVVFTPGLLAKVTSWSARTPSALAAIQDEINQRNQQIADLERQIGEYQKQIDDRRGKASSLSNEIAIMKAQINNLQLKIPNFSLYFNPGVICRGCAHPRLTCEGYFLVRAYT